MNDAALHTCPSCGRPIRPGTKFCGNCGATLPAVPAGKPQAAEVAPASGQAACPHCGKPVRLEARFCPNCGQTLAKAPLRSEAYSAATPATPPPGVLQPVSPPPQAVERSSAQPPPTPAQPLKTAPSTPAEVKPAPRKRTGKFWLLVGGAVVAIIVFGAFSVLMLSQTDVFDRATGTPAITATSKATAPFILPPSQPIAPSPTQTLTPSSSNTSTGMPSLTATATITPTAFASASPTLSVTPSVKSLAIDATPALSETFSSNDLAKTWEIWGTSYDITTDGKFELKGLTPTNTGIASQQNFLARESTIIQFEVTLMGNSSQDMILFNWDPQLVNRGAKTVDGPIHIQIGGDKPKIKVGLGELPLPLLDNQSHTYQIQILKDNLLAFSIDGREIGKLPLPALPIVNGKISFSGTGRIDNILVFTPTDNNPPGPTAKPAARSRTPTLRPPEPNPGP